jgi:SAM-dependent methyltransferase
MSDRSHALNGICPYYTMFPLAFPLETLRRRRRPRDRWVLDPFCGRGTTNFAARVVGLDSVGVDASPVAVAIAKSKIAVATPASVVEELSSILSRGREAAQTPTGSFWERAYDPGTLRDLCVVREALLRTCETRTRVVLRAIILGALHGPLGKKVQSHLSNQCPRTFAPKPRYALKFWRARRMRPPQVDLQAVVRARAERYLTHRPYAVRGAVILGDSRESKTFQTRRRFDWVITSPPYYGMTTYVPDQWLRNWFLGGPSEVDYASNGQVSHTNAEIFTCDLHSVWENVARVCNPGARLVCRFGGIQDRAADPLGIIRDSLIDSGWRVTTIRSAGDARDGRRQAEHFVTDVKPPRAEYDVYAVLE